MLSQDYKTMEEMPLVKVQRASYFMPSNKQRAKSYPEIKVRPVSRVLVSEYVPLYGSAKRSARVEVRGWLSAATKYGADGSAWRQINPKIGGSYSHEVIYKIYLRNTVRGMAYALARDVDIFLFAAFGLCHLLR